MGLVVPVLGHTGPLVDDEPAWTEVDFASLSTISEVHNEAIDNPSNVYKGWWYVNLNNYTSTAWAGVTITAGPNDLVAIVQGNGLEDEWGFIGNSVVANKAGTATYNGYIGDRTYTNGAEGQLWQSVTFMFDQPLTQTQKAGFKVYTDNSYYEGPYASSFCVCFTPIAVPEPGSLVALFGGVTALAAFARRRK